VIPQDAFYGGGPGVHRAAGVLSMPCTRLQDKSHWHLRFPMLWCHPARARRIRNSGGCFCWERSGRARSSRRTCKAGGESPRSVQLKPLKGRLLGRGVSGRPVCVLGRAQRVPGDQRASLGSGAMLGATEPEEQRVPRESRAGR